MCSLGAGGLWGGGDAGMDGTAKGRGERGEGSLHPVLPLRSCPSSSPRGPRTPVHPRPVENSPLSSCPPLRLFLAHLPKEQPRNYTLHLYNKCSHIHDLISASSGPGRGQVGLSILVAQVGRLRLRKEK